MIEICEVKTRSQLRKFIAFPFSLYKDCPYWVPPLNLDEMNTLRRDKNPAFAYCEARYWLAYREGKPVGRIAGIINHSAVKKWGKKYIRFGWIDFIDDLEVCKALLDTVEKWGQENGMEGAHGPLGFCDLDKEGLLVEGFDKTASIITFYNFPYYRDHIEACGYQKDVEWVELTIPVPDSVPERLVQMAQRSLQRNHLKAVRLKSIKDVMRYAGEVFQLINEAYKELYGVVPLTDEQVRYYIQQYFNFINPGLIGVILDEQGKIAAFGITMPSLSEAFQKCRGRLFPMGFLHILGALRRNKKLDLYMIAARHDMQGKGVTAAILAELTRAAISEGFEVAETALMLEENVKVLSLWKEYDAKVHKRRRCYLKKFEE